MDNMARKKRCYQIVYEVMMTAKMNEIRHVEKDGGVIKMLNRNNMIHGYEQRKAKWIFASDWTRENAHNAIQLSSISVCPT